MIAIPTEKTHQGLNVLARELLARIEESNGEYDKRGAK
jgi:hypothetical protein